jgi:MarR family transcriptional regulator for hemolysin
LATSLSAATGVRIVIEREECEMSTRQRTGPPVTEPVGLQLSRIAKVVSRAFDDALAKAGGSLPMWLVLVSIKAQHHGVQRDLARAVGVEGPTLTHHLNKMETAGLLTRTRDRENRRVHRVVLTEAGEEAFQRLRAAALAFDHQLRRGVTKSQLETLGAIFARLQANAEASQRALEG